MKLTRINYIGFYKHKVTGREESFRVGRDAKAGIHRIFYLRRGCRVFMSRSDFVNNWQKKVNHETSNAVQ